MPSLIKISSDELSGFLEKNAVNNIYSYDKKLKRNHKKGFYFIRFDEGDHYYIDYHNKKFVLEKLIKYGLPEYAVRKDRKDKMNKILGFIKLF